MTTEALPPAVRFVFVKPNDHAEADEQREDEHGAGAQALKGPERDLHDVLAHASCLVRLPASARHVVVDEAALHFFHRDALGLVGHIDLITELRPRAAAQLLRAQRRDVHEQKPALDRRQRLRLGYAGSRDPAEGGLVLPWSALYR